MNRFKRAWRIIFNPLYIPKIDTTITSKISGAEACPFCGSSKIYIGQYGLSCLDCGASGPMADKPVRMLKNWNQRKNNS